MFGYGISKKGIRSIDEQEMGTSKGYGGVAGEPFARHDAEKFQPFIRFQAINGEAPGRFRSSSPAAFRLL